MAKLRAVPLEERHFPETAELLVRVFGGTVDQKLEIFTRQWSLNPAWNSDIPRGWIVTSDNGGIVAHTANIPILYTINNVAGLCCATGGTAVHPNWRGRGLAKIVGEAFVNQKIDLLIGVDSTPPAFNLWLKLGMKPLDRSWAKHRAIVGNVGALIQNKLGGNASSILGTTTERVLRALAMFTRPRVKKAVSITRATRFSSSDGPHLKLCRASELSTYATRNVDVLNWLYFGSEYVRSTRVVFVARVRNELLGYIALKQIGSDFRLLECRCREADPDIAATLLWAARDYAERERIPYVSVWPYTQMLKDALPKLLSVPTARPILTYCYRSNIGMIDEHSWESSPGDGDLSIY